MLKRKKTLRHKLPKRKNHPQTLWVNISIMKNWIDSFLKSKGPFHLLIILGFTMVSLLFYYPLLSGKIQLQSDIRQYEGMSRQLKDYRAETGKETYWIDNAFGGMPTYQLGANYPGDFLNPVYSFFRILPRPAHILFLYLLGAYLLLLILKLPWHSALFGALAFGFSTYLLIILQVGHNTKALAISFFPFVLAGVVLLFRKHYFWGFLLSSLALGMQIRANHYQMTYYLLLFLGVFVVVWGFKAYKEKLGKSYCIALGLLFLSGIVALGFNATPLLATAEYAKFSTRGKSELRLEADGSPKAQTDGLDYAYITEYSYGIFESLNLIAPRIQGGGSSENLGEKHGVYEFLLSKGVRPAQARSFSENVPTYWGSQPILEAPAYIGISVFFFALLGFFYIRSPIRNALAIGSIVSLVLSWGKNFAFVTQLFIDYVPFYNKFRAVSSIQVILELCFPILAALGVHWAITKQHKFDLKKFAKITLAPVLVMVLLFLFGGTFSFVGVNDAYFTELYGAELVEVIRSARKSIFQEDILRAIAFLLILTGIVIWYQIKNANKNLVLGLLFTLLLVDLVGISTRYIHREAFVFPSQASIPFQATGGDLAIQQDSTRYRVYEPQLGLTGARTAYFHNTLGGYHGAKPRRFEELFEYYNTHQITEVLDFLNVKYVLVADEDNNGLQPLSNPNALGNAWAIEELKRVPTADALLEELKTTNFKKQAVVLDESLPKEYPLQYTRDSLLTISLNAKAPDHLEYQIESEKEQFVVFSEMYYPKGWTATVNGQIEPIINVNYVLRGLRVPEGKVKVVFKFDPPVVALGTKLRWASLFVFLLSLFSLYFVSSPKQIKTA